MKCETSGGTSDGGGIYLASPRSDSSIRNCVFDSCLTGGSCEGIFLKNVKNVEDSLFLYFCFFQWK
jgi:hypothetical protein